uniref:HD domain-containing protein n=1 Tax=Panagrolaimus superbus TaxID=310955 RepID=A0A914YAA2_9BILA
MPVDWDPNSQCMMQFNNGSSGVISLPKVFKGLIDTPEFQRLRYIKQLGPTFLVFPNADHSRFVHSLGTASFAFQFMMELRKQCYNAKKMVTGNDIIAVTLAALCHDLGHGPFSHMYEEVFAVDVHERHETLSIKIFDKILKDHPDVKEAFKEYFDEKTFNLVRQLIDPPEYCKTEREWPLLVGKEKAFLFSIVSNSLNGLDVDKLDYLIRDSERSGIPVSISKNVVKLLFDSAQIVKHPDHEFTWIAFPEKYTGNVISIFEARKRLHEELYNHRVIVAISELIKQALQCVGDELEILGSNNNPIKLKDCTSDLNAYLKLNDSIIDLIINSPSTEPKMLEAKMIIKNIELRKFPRVIAKLDNLNVKDNNEFENEVRKAILELEIVDDSQLITVIKVFHFGKGYHNPIGDVLFYVRNSDALVRHADDISCYRTCLFVFAQAGCSDDDARAIYERLLLFAEKKGLQAPTKLCT